MINIQKTVGSVILFSLTVILILKFRRVWNKIIALSLAVSRAPHFVADVVSLRTDEQTGIRTDWHKESYIFTNRNRKDGGGGVILLVCLSVHTQMGTPVPCSFPGYWSQVLSGGGTPVLARGCMAYPPTQARMRHPLARAGLGYPLPARTGLGYPQVRMG